MANISSTSSFFLLLQFSEIREMQILHFVVFLMLYLAIVTANVLVILAVALDHHLHTPMYFFLKNLAIQDVGSVSVIIPKSVINSLINSRHISYSGCVAQVFVFLFFTASNLALLTVMAYDRYVAICNPLQYEMLVNKQACALMAASAWISGLFYAILHTGGTFASPFCSNVISQFFCEIPHLLKIACSDLYLIEIGVLGVSIAIAFGCFIFIIVTYVHIFSAVLKIPSAQGRQKAFSTCVPHLTVVSTLMFSGIFAYIGHISNMSQHLNIVFTVIYSIVPPILNPVIYSMRNKDIKNAMSKILGMRNSQK